MARDLTANEYVTDEFDIIFGLERELGSDPFGIT